MRTERDAIRSLRKYMTLVLGADWEVRLWADEGSFKAPLARVAESAPALYTSHRVRTDIVLPMQVHCYLTPVDTVTKALAAAREVRETLAYAVEVGVGLARPRRIPLYDYAGLDDSTQSDARNDYDYLKVIDLSLASVQDSAEPTAVVVVANLRLGWSRDTTVDPHDLTVNSLRVTQRLS